MAGSRSAILTQGIGTWGNAGLIITMGFGPAIAPTTCVLTGTVTAGITEADIVAGGKTIILTLTNDTWVSAGANFNNQRQAIIDGLVSNLLDPFGWVNVVRALQSVAGVVRTNATTVTITLDAFPTYNILTNETITDTVPSTALVTSLVAVVATPTFTVSFIPPPPPPVVDSGITPSGGFPATDSGPTREQIRRARTLHGLPQSEAEIVEAVAKRQAEALEQDEVKRQQELSGELALRQVEARSEHYRALAEEREALIHEEIGRRLRQMQANNDAILLLLIAAASL